MTHAGAAELRGQILFDQAGEEPFSAAERLPVSIAAIPLDDQTPEPVEAASHTVHLTGEGLDPMYLAVSAGDRITFVNRSNTYHELYTRFEAQPFGVQVAVAGSGEHRQSLTLSVPGVRHLFCRIHRRTYARIDVVDTPHVKMIREPGLFQFNGIAPGRWRLRAATIATAVSETDAQAFTSPPTVYMRLPVPGRTRADKALERFDSEAVQVLFPKQ